MASGGAGYSASNSQQTQSDYGAISVAGPTISFGNAVMPSTGSTAAASGVLALVPKPAWYALGGGFVLLALGLLFRFARRG